MNPVLAIAAGAAAIAIAATIKGAIKGAAESVGGSGGGGYGGGYSGATGHAATSLPDMIQIEGVLKGSDIVISSRRYTNNRNSVT